MGQFAPENRGTQSSFTEETPGTPAGVVVEPVSIVASGFVGLNIRKTDYLSLLNNTPATPFQFEDVPGVVLEDFTGSQFGDDTYFRFGHDNDFNLGYASSEDQLVALDSSNNVLFGVDKTGSLRMKQQTNVPPDSEVNSDFAKVGSEYYLRKDDTGDTYNMS